MTAFLLLKALCDFLKQSVAEYAAAQNENGEYRAPEVFEWYLPFKNPKLPDKIDFPYIVARIENGEGTYLSTVQVELSFGVYCEGNEVNGFIHPDGAYDLLNLMEHVRIALLRKEVLDNKFRIEKPYKWEIPDEQPYPLWVGRAQCVWSVQSVIQNTEGVDVHGHKFDWE